MKYTVWVWSDRSSDWRRVRSKRRWQKETRLAYSRKRAAELVKQKRRRGQPAIARPASSGKPDRAPRGKSFMSERERKWQLIRKQLTGDLDAKTDLLYALAQVSRDLGIPLYVAEGTRSIRDQWKYWLLYKAGRGPLAAYPGTSNHTHGDAADVRRTKTSWQNIGQIPNAKTLMAKYGLCLPVPGEPWHVEFGNNWRN